MHPDTNLSADLSSPDEHVRAKAARRLCPCHGSFDLFEQYRAEIKRLQKDPSPLVRAVALHLEEDAFQIDAMAMARADPRDPLARRRRTKRPRPMRLT